MKISIIIPVYNVENFLERCLQSVENQTFKNFEAIIINDGSPDNSYKIIDKFVERNDNFVTYKIENSGLGGARNFGLTKAQGEYIVFLDSDDYIAADCLEKFINKAETDNSDIVVCTSCDVTETGSILSYSKNHYDNAVTSLNVSPQILLDRLCAWAKMYRRSLFGDLTYVAREWYEDLRLTPKLYLKANKISFIEDCLFFYVQREGSIMNNSKAIRNLEIIDAFEDVITYFKDQKVYEIYKDEIEFLVLNHLVIAAMTRVALCKSSDKKTVLKKLEEYASKFDNLLKNKYISTLSSSKKLVLAFNTRRLYFLTALCMRLKNLISK